MTQPDNSTTSPARWERLITTSLIVLGLILILFFGFRAARSFLRIQLTGLEPGVTDVEAVRGWMTIPYIAAAYDVPEAYLFASLNISPENNRDKSLGQLNREYRPGEQGVMIDQVKAAIRQYQAENPDPPEPANE